MLQKRTLFCIVKIKSLCIKLCNRKMEIFALAPLRGCQSKAVRLPTSGRQAEGISDRKFVCLPTSGRPASADNASSRDRGSGDDFKALHLPTSGRQADAQNIAEYTKISSSYRGGLSRRDSPQFLWDLKGLNTSSARAAFRWAVFMACFAGLPPAYSFLGKAAILWNAVNNGLFILTAVA